MTVEREGLLATTMEVEEISDIDESTINNNNNHGKDKQQQQQQNDEQSNNTTPSSPAKTSKIVASTSTLVASSELLSKILQIRKQMYQLEKDKSEMLTQVTDKVNLIPLYANTLFDAHGDTKQAEMTQTESGIQANLVNFEEKNFLYQVPEHCIPIRADVTSFNWKELARATKFDVITMDPPWQLACANPTRGVSIAYSQLSDDFIEKIPVNLIGKENSLLFVWVINVKYSKTLKMMKNWGYTFVDDVAWVKRTVNRRLAKGHGYYLQHAKETCLVGVRGDPKIQDDVKKYLSDVIYSERRGQSQKPEELYEIIEDLVPNGRYIEIFARKNNLRNYWVSVGNEL
eukprot:GEZU01006750.1.p1 GENE.GEZU01006750.1~~GEZU01006750.1.p1  ORF type:complete len:351 (-),score=103.34 GEZU01006750.1:417-1448(-)